MLIKNTLPRLSRALSPNNNSNIFSSGSHYNDHRFRPPTAPVQSGENEETDPIDQAKKMATSTRAMADLVDKVTTNRAVRPGSNLFGGLFGGERRI